MNMQDEGHIDPFETPYSGGISEFARLQEEREGLIAQGVDPEELEVPIDPAAVTGDERQFEREDFVEGVSEIARFPLDDEGRISGPGEFSETTMAESLGRGLDQARARELSDGPAEMQPGDFARGGLVGQNSPVVGTTPSEPVNRRKDTNPKDGVGALKPSYSAVPVPVLYELGAALTEGARKYGGYNWRVAGVRASVYLDATRRHLDAWWEGQDIDPDSGLSHITKAIASLTVLRDAQIQSMLSNDDRPPRTQRDFMAAMQERVNEIRARYPDPLPPFTQEQVAHIRDEPLAVVRGRVIGFEVEVMLPAPPEHPEGFVWAQQGSRRTDLDQALAVAQALREDGYGERVVRVTGIFERTEVMPDGNEWVVGEMREQITTVFPGDPSLMEATEADLDGEES
jgi:hypothetical protein